MTQLIAILLVALCFEAAGVVLLSRGLKQLAHPATPSLAAFGGLLLQAVTNRDLILGVAFEAVFFLGLLILMSRAAVSFVLPLTALSFVFTTAAARLFLNESISGARWAGVLLIMAGAALITYSEHQQKRRVPEAAENSTAR